MTRLAALLLLPLAGAVLQDDGHAKDCCRKMMHTLEVKKCTSCERDGAGCRLCSDCADEQQACPHCVKDLGFTSMFDGKSLDGWKAMGGDTWKVEKGVLQTTSGRGHWLRTEKEYEDFIWKLEYRVMKKDGNSGMFVRATEKGNPAFTGMEIQILGDHGKKPDVHSSHSLYGSVAPTKNMAKPAGEWNTVMIICKKRRLKARVNGEWVFDVDLDDKSLPFQSKALSKRARKGYLGMQHHGSLVEFRNLRVKEIE